tara:strand:- start:65 stop:205 length:141 start_codon:yes stop_codon:yes gene_type:complete
VEQSGSGVLGEFLGDFLGEFLGDFGFASFRAPAAFAMACASGLDRR